MNALHRGWNSSQSCLRRCSNRRLVDLDDAGVEFVLLARDDLLEQIDGSFGVAVGKLRRFVAELQGNVVLVVRRRDVEASLFLDVLMILRTSCHVS